MSRLSVVLLMLTFAVRLSAQESDLIRRFDAIESGSAAATAKVSPEKATAKPPTEITATKEVTYEEKGRRAVFTGDVHVNDPQFKIICDKLTAFLRPSATSGKAEPKATPDAVPPPEGGGGLQRAIAEGNVLIVQEKPAENGNKPQRNVGKCAWAEYNADTGDVTLKGWPQVQQGINTQIATAPETYMIMNHDERRMKTVGPSKTVLKEQSDTPPKRP